MKKLRLVLVLVSLALFGTAQSTADADAILGVWETGSGKARVEIKKAGGKYYGQIVWLKQPLNEQGKPKTDKNNPDQTKQNTPLIGLRMLLGFEYAGNKSWKNGTIYDPENGSTYNCKAELTSATTLNIRGYIGISLIGRTDTWKRIQ